MAEAVTLGLFVAGLISCIAAGLSIIWALALGLVIFLGYGLYEGHRLGQLLKMSLSGVLEVKNVLIVFVSIGALTALWRAAGTIPFIIFHATRLITPDAFILATFLLCCLVSVLTGTSFGTCATMGVICVMMANAMGVSILWTGAAALSGGFFGDRCSPMSTSALLVAELTDTTVFANIPKMVKTALVPFLLTCVIFLLAGFFLPATDAPQGQVELFAQSFSLHPLTVVPAAVIIILSLLKVNVKITVAVSVLCAGLICFFLQGMTLGDILSCALSGYRSRNTALDFLLGGGGLVSMLTAAGIVLLSSCYTGIFEGTGLLDGVKRLISIMARRLTPFGAMCAASLFTAMVGCNQTLAIMLTHQLCGDIAGDDRHFAIDLENTAVLLSPLVPWCIAGAVPLATLGAPTSCLILSVYLYLVPAWRWIVQAREKPSAQIPRPRLKKT